MAKRNRTLHVELRLINVDDDQYEACKELMTNLAKDAHASATLLCAGASRPKVFHYGEAYRYDVANLPAEPEQQEN